MTAPQPWNSEIWPQRYVLQSIKCYSWSEGDGWDLVPEELRHNVWGRRQKDGHTEYLTRSKAKTTVWCQVSSSVSPVRQYKHLNMLLASICAHVTMFRCDYYRELMIINWKLFKLISNVINSISGSKFKYTTDLLSGNKVEFANIQICFRS